MYNPVATYRLQFHEKFTFAAFEQIIGYLQQLGVSTIYASPVFEADPSSTHGYDGVNPHRINPEIGTEEQLLQISARLKEQQIGWLQDIVPNHMGYSQHNPWLMDVLEKGSQSAYASFFDSARTSMLFNEDRLMVPFLGSSLEQIIQGGELTVAYQDGWLALKYYDSYWPLSPKSYSRIFGSAKAKNSQLQQLLSSFESTQSDTDTFAGLWDEFRANLQAFSADKKGSEYINRALKAINNNPDVLNEIADEQAYRLCSYEETDQNINFRRFFTVNSLICLNIQDEAVFDEFHKYIKTLTDQGVFQGLRIDHIDGLYNPEQYLNRLRQLAGPETYIVTEKILEQGEDMPHQWPVQGNTGYDFLAQLNNLFTNPDAEKPFTRFYQQLVNDETPVKDQILQKKAYILKEHMGGELDNLCQLFYKLKLGDKKMLAEVSSEQMREAIGQLLIHCPVYRYYGNEMPLKPKDEQTLKTLIHTAANAHAELAPAFNILTEVLLRKPQHAKDGYNKRALQFYQRLMQFSGPLMAKGVEDTLMYTYNRFIGHNDVGDAPEAFGSGTKAFHRLMKERQKYWPLSVNGTSTHDTKRGEDVRARLNVLTDLPQEWLQAVHHWQELNAGLKQDTAPDANDEYFIYQTLTGVYPMPGQDEDDIGTRLPEYLTKALREAKVNTTWTAPNESYERAALNFGAALLDKNREFWASFSQFQQRVVDFGIVNSLAQVLLKFTCPGVSDVYQGCELWDLSMVDPDNRRPVDYNQRKQLLQQLTDSAQAPEDRITHLWNDRYNGQIKLWLTQLLFKQRQQSGELFSKGHYLPLKVKGAYADHIIAFARRHHAEWAVVVAPVRLAELTASSALTAIDWKDTCIVLPDEAPTRWQHQLLNTTGPIAGAEIKLQEVLGTLPLALLKLHQPENKRSAGILMHITSLPSVYGIGDIGPGARRFAQFLSKGGQRIWQLLPLNPVSADQQFSPYSSGCSMAGNILLISPEELAKQGLLTVDELKQHELPLTARVDFETVIASKEALFAKAYQRYLEDTPAGQHQQFEAFCRQEAYWLNDYALYTVIREQQNNLPWYKWPDELKLRKIAAINRLAKAQQAALNKVKWLQFQFIQQWNQLKDYCHSYRIQLFGDLPFYVSYDSADVWANRSIFSIDAQGNRIGVAGVPPDYFNADGQLWGMPVYNWQQLKATGYQWWINRLRKNMELFDLLRLDHFRAFEAYWQVPASETTARNGQWETGPGSDFFTTIKSALGELPFIAEDLGDVDDKVFALRDDFGLPGMKVLQFAFGDTMPASLYIPHNYEPNYFAYTGTHDNNTSAGWYRQDAGKKVKQQLEEYLGQKVSAKNIHKVLGRMAYASAAKAAILPLQDVLGLDENSRMNNPASVENNWLWRLPKKRLSKKAVAKLLHWAKLYNRI
jgi:malto-oligosyltrehalose synthase/4-alpha-glucanotransferase